MQYCIKRVSYQDGMIYQLIYSNTIEPEIEYEGYKFDIIMKIRKGFKFYTWIDGKCCDEIIVVDNSYLSTKGNDVSYDNLSELPTY